jgi:hypothetical protein
LLIAFLILTPFGFSQPEAAGGKASAGRERTPLRAGTQINAELESSLDALSDKPGQEVAARVIKDVKQDGRLVIRKGDRLVGRIVQTETGLRVSVNFDRLVAGKTVTALDTVVIAVPSQGDVLGALLGPTPQPTGPTAGRSEFTFGPDNLRLEAGTELRFRVVDPAQKGKRQ